MARPVVPVVAGALVDARGRVLITQRPAGKHMAGAWEFPGGKSHRGESPREALARELDEELGVGLGAARRLIRIRHAYPDRVVELDVWRVAGYSGEPQGRDGQALRWVAPEELAGQGILEADRPVIAALNLPERCIVLSAAARLAPSIRPATADFVVGEDLICLRADSRSALEALAGRGEPSVRRLLVADTERGPGWFRGLDTRMTAWMGNGTEGAAALGHGMVADFAVLAGSSDNAPAGGTAAVAAVLDAASCPVYLEANLVGGDPERAFELGAQGLALCL